MWMTEVAHHWEWSEVGGNDANPVGIGALAFGKHAFTRTLLFDPSMSALPIIETQKSQSVGFLTRQLGTWAGFGPSWDRFVSPCWRTLCATVIEVSTRGTLHSWKKLFAEKRMLRSCHLWDYIWTPPRWNSCWSSSALHNSGGDWWCFKLFALVTCESRLAEK